MWIYSGLYSVIQFSVEVEITHKIIRMHSVFHSLYVSTLRMLIQIFPFLPHRFTIVRLKFAALTLHASWSDANDYGHQFDLLINAIFFLLVGSIFMKYGMKYIFGIGFWDVLPFELNIFHGRIIRYDGIVRCLTMPLNRKYFKCLAYWT